MQFQGKPKLARYSGVVETCGKHSNWWEILPREHATAVVSLRS